MNRRSRRSSTATRAGKIFLSEEDAEILRGIVYGADKVVCTDEAVIDIITRAVTPYLEGKGTAEDAAREIQSRMSIYLAEQA